MPKIKVLSLGLSQSNFLIQLYSEIKKRADYFDFSVDGFYDLSEGQIENEIRIFERFHEFSKKPTSKARLFITALKICRSFTFWRFLIFEYRLGIDFRDLKSFLRSQIRTKHIIDFFIRPCAYDIYQFHYCVPFNLRYVHYLPKNSKIVCSFWGSDLYRIEGEKREYYVSEALNRANAISIQTPEMGVYLMKKYGAHLKPKITYAQFALEPKIYELMDYYAERKEHLIAYKKKLGIPLVQNVIAIGYNANKAFRHHQCLKVISELPENLRQSITVVLCLTYQRNDEYLRELTEYVKSLNRVNVVLLHDFLAHDEVAKLRLLTDIQIQMPISDALSGSVTEVLYAGNTVIAGDWLPYAIFERKGVTLKSVADFDELESVLLDVLNNLSDYKNKNANNTSAIKDHFFPNETSKAWIGMYHKLMSN